MNFVSKINNKIDAFKKEERLKATEDAFKFWANKKYLYPLFAIPITEVSVERLFSNVHFIINPLRTRLNINENHLNNILFVRSNFQLIDENNHK